MSTFHILPIGLCRIKLTGEKFSEGMKSFRVFRKTLGKGKT